MAMYEFLICLTVLLIQIGIVIVTIRTKRARGNSPLELFNYIIFFNDIC